MNKKNKNGQSIVEYALIAILVILGIVFMGPYVLRSINAHFKLWDEGVQDSFHEHLTQAPLNDLPVINIDCQCTTTTGQCGSSDPIAQCPANERIKTVSCNPQGCNPGPPSNCTDPDPTCCSGWTNTGCGTIPLGQPPTATNCNYGYQIQSHLCGTDNSIKCVLVDPSICPPPKCQGFFLFLKSTFYCATGTSTAPTTSQSPGLIKNTPNFYVGNSPTNCNSTDGPCQVYCNPPYTVNSTTHPTACILQFTVAPLCDQTNFKTMPSTCVCTSGCRSNTPTYTNTENFQMCLDPTTLFTSVALVPYGPTVTASPPIPENNGGCGNPGEPSQICAMDVNF